jgi:Ala-tRNA(Pro) deacylase
MNEGTERLQRLLDSEGIDYELIHHRTDYRASVTAADTHTPAEEFAKTVFVWIDGKPAMAVVPASKHVALSRLRKELGAEEVHVATEADADRLCPDCEAGAAPPFGNLYDLPVYVSTTLAEDEYITFNGGDHQNAFRLAYADFVRLVQPQVLALARHDPDPG